MTGLGVSRLGFVRRWLIGADRGADGAQSRLVFVLGRVVRAARQRRLRSDINAEPLSPIDALRAAPRRESGSDGDRSGSSLATLASTQWGVDSQFDVFCFSCGSKLPCGEFGPGADEIRCRCGAVWKFKSR